MQVRNGKKVKHDKKLLNTFTKQAEPLLVSAIRRGGKKAQSKISAVAFWRDNCCLNLLIKFKVSTIVFWLSFI